MALPHRLLRQKKRSKNARSRPKPPKGGAFYRQLWRLVDGAVADTIANHPEYIGAGIHPKDVRTSINKRVVGAIMGYATAFNPPRRADPEDNSRRLNGEDG